MLIFDFSDYRSYLRHFLDRLPKKGRGEVNRMALAMSVHPSLVSQVLAGGKHFNLEQGQALTEYLGLSNAETEFFLTMILYQRAGTQGLKNYYKQKLDSQKNAANELVDQVQQDRKLTEEEKAIFFSHWHYNAAWLLTSIAPGKTLEQIIQYLEISRDRAKTIMDFLLATKLCISASGFYQMGPKSLHLERVSPFVIRHHANWRLKVLENGHKLSAEELMYTGPVSISKNDFIAIRNRLTELIKEYSQTAMASPAEELACLNLDFFWIK